MPEPDKDDLADALSRLASGDAPSTPEGVPSEQVPFHPKEKTKRPASPVPSRPSVPSPNPGLPPGAEKGRSGPTSRPNAPGVQPPSPKPTTPPKPRATGAPKSPKIVRPAAPMRPQAPLPPVTGAAPLPPIRPPSSDPSDISSSLANVVDDDDAVIVPAPSPEVFVHRPAPRAKHIPVYLRLSFRRTLIPILLTMGVALPACALWWCLQDEDSPIKLLGLRFPITLAVVGVVLLVLGIVNVLQVRAELATAQVRSTIEV